MPEPITVEPTDEKTGTTEETTTETKEETTETKSEVANLYEEKLKQLELENKQKEGALKEERRLRKEAEEAAKSATTATPTETTAISLEDKPLTRKDVESIMAEKLVQREMETQLGVISSDPAEQKLIRHHYENSIVRTGNVANDLAMAAAITNQHLIDEARRVQTEREASEARMAGFQGGKPSGKSGKPAYESDPRLREVANILDRFGEGSAKKYL